MIGFMVVVPMVVASQGPIMLVLIGPHWWGPFKVGEVPNEGQESIIGDVESGELGGIFLFLELPIGALFVLALVAFLLGRTLGGRFTVLGGYHNSLRPCSDVVFQSREFICLTVQFFHSHWRVQGQRLEEWGGWPETSFEVLQDCIHTVHVDLLDGLLEPACEVSDGLVFSFQDCLEGANVPLLPDRA